MTIATQVLQAELLWSARPLSPQLTEAFGDIKKQVDSVSEQVACLQLSVDRMQAPTGERQAGSHSSAATASSAPPPTKRQRLVLALEAQAGLSSGISTVQARWTSGSRACMGSHPLQRCVSRLCSEASI